MADWLKCNFLNTTAIIVVHVLTVAVDGSIRGGIKPRDVSSPRVPRPRSLIVEE